MEAAAAGEDAPGPGRVIATAAEAGAVTADAGGDRRPTTDPNPGADPGRTTDVKKYWQTFISLCTGTCIFGNN